MNKQDVRVGQQVTVDATYPGIWTVVKINPTNVKLEQNGRRLNAHPSFLTLATGDAAKPTTFVTSAPLPPLAVGAIVKLRDKDGFFVVIRDGVERVNVAKLGGDAGRYWRAPRATITEVDATQLLSLVRLSSLADDDAAAAQQARDFDCEARIS